MQKNLGKIKRTVEEYVVLTVATLILVVGVYVFKFPNNFSFGGVTGLAVVPYFRHLREILPLSSICCCWYLDLYSLEEDLESKLFTSVY